MEQIIKIAAFIIDSFLHIWPYLLITIPIAVFVNLSGTSKHISRVLSKKPLVSIFLATAVGALSPFCSCGVIPVIASLLIGGVPLAPVMSFWIASPSMDPEIFFLSTATIGWELSVWRLIATFMISLLSGYITHLFILKGWLGENILKKNLSTEMKHPFGIAFRKTMTEIGSYFKRRKAGKQAQLRLVPVNNLKESTTMNCCLSADKLQYRPEKRQNVRQDTSSNSSCRSNRVTFRKKLLAETMKATFMVARFMTLAFLINALIQFYVPQESISGFLANGEFLSIITASLIGIPFYTSNIAALPLVSGLLEMGMNEGAALAFLISGPITTLPAMSAVWGLVNRRIFFMYISFALIGSVLFGICINF